MGNMFADNATISFSPSHFQPWEVCWGVQPDLLLQTGRFSSFLELVLGSAVSSTRSDKSISKEKEGRTAHLE